MFVMFMINIFAHLLNYRSPVLLDLFLPSLQGAAKMLKCSTVFSPPCSQYVQFVKFSTSLIDCTRQFVLY